MFGLDGHRHAFLGFRHPDFPNIQTIVFERHVVEIHPGAAGKPGRLTDRRRQPPATVVGDESNEPLIAGFQQEIVHFLLRVGVADLHVPRRGVFAVDLAGSSNTVDAVFSDAPAAHHDEIPILGAFLFGRFPQDGSRHDPQRSHKHQTLTQVGGMVKEVPEGRGHTMFVAAVAHPFDHSVQQPAWVQVWAQRPGVIAGTDAEPIEPSDQAGALAGPSGSR